MRLLMKTVLIAVDDTNASVGAAEAAHRLFGDDAKYLVMHVGHATAPGQVWGMAYPITAPATAVPAPFMIEPALHDERSSADEAALRAADVAGAAQIPAATALGDVGDPADAIIRAGRQHQADVVVVGSHEQSWFNRLVKGSVQRAILDEAEIPVLVVK